DPQRLLAAGLAFARQAVFVDPVPRPAVHDLELLRIERLVAQKRHQEDAEVMRSGIERPRDAVAQDAHGRAREAHLFRAAIERMDGGMGRRAIVFTDHGPPTDGRSEISENQRYHMTNSRVASRFRTDQLAT